MRIITRFATRVVGLTCLVVCLTGIVAANGRVETVRFQSKLVNAALPYNVVLPTDYDTSRTTRYPVLYLLHGLTGHYSDWVSRTNVADYASEYRMIVVMLKATTVGTPIAPPSPPTNTKATFFRN